VQSGSSRRATDDNANFLAVVVLVVSRAAAANRTSQMLASTPSHLADHPTYKLINAVFIFGVVAVNVAAIVTAMCVDVLDVGTFTVKMWTSSGPVSMNALPRILIVASLVTSVIEFLLWSVAYWKSYKRRQYAIFTATAFYIHVFVFMLMASLIGVICGMTPVNEKASDRFVFTPVVGVYLLVAAVGFNALHALSYIIAVCTRIADGDEKGSLLVTEVTHYGV